MALLVLPSIVGPEIPIFQRIQYHDLTIVSDLVFTTAVVTVCPQSDEKKQTITGGCRNGSRNADLHFSLV